MSIINKAHAVVATPKVGKQPVALVADPSGENLVYVADRGSDQVTEIDRVNPTTIDLPAGPAPTSLADDGREVVVGLAGSVEPPADEDDDSYVVDNSGVATIGNATVTSVDTFSHESQSVYAVLSDPLTGYSLVAVTPRNEEQALTSYLRRGNSTSVPLSQTVCCWAGAVLSPGHSAIWTVRRNQLIRIGLPTPPVVHITRPKPNAVYHQGQRATFSFTCSSTTNDVAACYTYGGNQHSGARIPTNDTGKFQIEVRAKASDGQVGSRTVTYFVVPKKR